MVLGLVAFIAVFRFRMKSTAQSELLGLSLFLAGGASNLFNHWTSEVVTDPLQLYIGAGEYMPFNIADVGISVGIILVLVAIAREAAQSSRAALRDRPDDF